MRKYRNSAFGFFIFAALAGPVAAQSNGGNGLAVPFRYNAALRMVLVDAKVDDRPAVLLVDTGATSTYLDAKSLKLKKKTEKTVATLGAGHAQQSPMFAVELEIAGTRIRGTLADVNLELLRQNCACQINGVLGMDFLALFDSLELNFQTKTLTMRRGNGQKEATK